MARYHVPITGQTRRYDCNAARGAEMESLVTSGVSDLFETRHRAGRGRHCQRNDARGAGEGRGGRTEGRTLKKNREMKQGPTMLLKIKDRFWEPKMSMKIKCLALGCRDIYET